MLSDFQCGGIRIWSFECSSNMQFYLVRGSTSDSFSGSFFFVREIYCHYRGSTSGSFFLNRERYWKVRDSSSLISEIFGGGLSLVNGRLGRLR